MEKGEIKGGGEFKSGVKKQALSTGLRIHWLYPHALQRDKTLPKKECPVCDTKLSNREAPILEIWEAWHTPSLLLLPGPL